MITRLFPVLAFFVLALAPAHAQNIEQLIQQYGDEQVPQEANILSSAEEWLASSGQSAGTSALPAELSQHLKSLAQHGVLKKNQLSGLQRAFQSAPQRTAAMVGEIRRFADELKQRDCLATLRSQLGANWRAHRARRLLLAGAHEVLGTISRRGGNLRELDTQTLRQTPFQHGDSIFSFGTRVNNMVQIPLGTLVLSIGAYGTYNILSRSGEPLVMTHTDPLYLTPWHLKKNAAASSWKQPICAYHFPEQGWTLIGVARTTAGRTSTLIVTDGQRSLIITRMDKSIAEIRAFSRPFTLLAADILKNTSQVEQLVFKNNRLWSNKKAMPVFRSSKALKVAAWAYDFTRQLTQAQQRHRTRLERVSKTLQAKRTASSRNDPQFLRYAIELLKQY